MFDPNEFITASAPPMSTKMEVCPEGEHPFVLDSEAKMLAPKNVKGVSDKGPYDFWQLELTCLCQNEAVKAKLGRQKVPVRLRVNLDLDLSTGKLESGPNKNVGLGKLREALGQNNEGWTPGDLLGAGPFIGLVKHSEGKDGNTYADIARVTKVS